MIQEFICVSFFFIYHALSVSRIGANGQECASKSNACPIKYNSLTSDGGATSLSGSIIECEQPFACCTCSSITCGTVQGKYCESFTALGNSAAFYVYPISIIGDPHDGTVIECDGYRSCQGTQIEATHVSEIKCVSESCCADTEWSINCVEMEGCTMECDGKESCRGSFTVFNAAALTCTQNACVNSEFVLYSDDSYIENGVDCDGVKACYESEITMSNAAHVECNGAYSCAGAVITVIDPKQHFELNCKRYRACQGLTFMVKVTKTSTVTQLQGFDCSSKEACKDVTIVIINENANAITFADLDCMARKSCANASFIVYEEPGLVSFTECECRRKDACLAATQNRFSSPIGCIPLFVEYNKATTTISPDTTVISPDTTVISPDTTVISPDTLQFNNISKLLCGETVICAFATIIVTDPRQGFKIECNGYGSCEGMNLEVIVPSSSSVTKLAGIECVSQRACLDTSISIVNKSPHLLIIDEIWCSSFGGCKGASFNLIGSIVFATCTCGDNGYGCLGALGIDACFENLDKLECRGNACLGHNITITNPYNNFELICGDVASCNDLTLTMIINDAANDHPIRRIKGITCDEHKSCQGLTLNVLNQQNGIKVNVNRIKCKGIDSCSGAIFNGNAQGNVIFKDIQCNGNCGVSGTSTQCIFERSEARYIFCANK